MISREQWRAFIDHPVVEWTIFVVGVILIVLSPIAGAIPGPGGIFVFALGLAMVLKTSMWAKRHYVRFKRKQPKIGRWADWGLRRRSALRRARLEQEQPAPEVGSNAAAAQSGAERGSAPVEATTSTEAASQLSKSAQPRKQRKNWPRPN